MFCSFNLFKGGLMDYSNYSKFMHTVFPNMGDLLPLTGQRNALISTAITQIDPRERDVLIWRYGLSSNDPSDPTEKTLEAIGKKLTLSRERVRQIEAKGIRRLRKIFENRGYLFFVPDLEIHAENLEKKNKELEIRLNEIKNFAKEIEIVIQRVLDDRPSNQRSEEIFQTPIDSLVLSVRTYNCLKNAKITTICDLIQITEAELLKIRNFGRKNLNEIKDLLVKLGLHLGTT